MKLELYQFELSHFNEKARWALDHKGLPYARRSLLPGPHKVRVRLLSGQEQVPVLRADGEVIAGSAAIIDFLERHFPEPPLYPRDPAERRRALALQAELDGELGPAIRRALFAELLKDAGYFTRSFTQGRAAPVRAAYRALFGGLRLVMVRELGITPEGVARGLDVTRDALDRVAREAGPSGWLAGEAFSVADLTAAALLAPAVLPLDCPMRFPEPRSPALEGWLARWREHPGAAWVHETYRKARGSSSAAA